MWQKVRHLLDYHAFLVRCHFGPLLTNNARIRKRLSQGVSKFVRKTVKLLEVHNGLSPVHDLCLYQLVENSHATAHGECQKNIGCITHSLDLSDISLLESRTRLAPFQFQTRHPNKF